MYSAGGAKLKAVDIADGTTGSFHSKEGPGESVLIRGPPSFYWVPLKVAAPQNYLRHKFDGYPRSASRVSDFSTILISASTIAPQKAGQNPRTMKSGASSVEANISISALMTHQKIPRVRKVRGKVMSFRKSPSVAFTSPITSAAISAALNPCTSNPGTTFDTISRLIALNNQFSSKRISFLSRPGSQIVFFARTMLTALVHQQVPLDEGNSREIIPRGRAAAPAVPPDPRCDKLMAEVVDDA